MSGKRKNLTATIKEDNHLWVLAQKAKSGQKIATIIDTLIEQAQMSGKFQIDKKLPAYIVKAQEAMEKRTEIIEQLSKPKTKLRKKKATQDASL